MASPIEEQLIQQQGQILNIVQQMSSSPMAARDYAAITQNRYVGNAVQGPSNGFMTTSGTLGHNPAEVSFSSMTSNPLVGGLLDAFVSPMINRLFSPLGSTNPSVMYAQNQSSVELNAANNAVASAVRDKIRSIEGLENTNPNLPAKFIANQIMQGGMTEQTLQLMERAGLTNDARVREGMLTSGAASIGLAQYGLMGSLTNRDKISRIRTAIEATAEADNGVSLVDALSTTSALADPRLDLNISEDTMGMDAGRLEKTTASLKRAKELTGMNATQTLGLLADVYDNVVEGVIPQIDDFVDRISRLERSGVSVSEFSSAVRGMRQRLNAAGVRDNRVAVEAVDRALGSRQDALSMSFETGYTGFNERAYSQSQLDQQAREATSGPARVLGVVAQMAGIKNSDELDTAIESGWEGYGLDPNLVADLQTGDYSMIKRNAENGSYANLTENVLRLGPTGNEIEMALGSKSWDRMVREMQFRASAAGRGLSSNIQSALNVDDETTRYQRFQDIMNIERLSRMEPGDERATARERYGLSLAEGGGWTSDALGNMTIGQDDIRNNTGLLLKSLMNSGFDIGRDQDNIDSELALKMTGLSGDRSRLGEDLQKAKKHLQNLDPRKTTISSRLGALMTATSKMRGETARNLPGLVRSAGLDNLRQGADSDLQEFLDGFKSTVANDEILRESIGDLSGVGSMEDLVQRLSAAQINNERGLQAPSGSLAFKKARETRIALEGLTSSLTYDSDYSPDQSDATNQDIVSAIESVLEWVKDEFGDGATSVESSGNVKGFVSQTQKEDSE